MADIDSVQSTNFGPRKHGRPPDMVVLHYTAMQTAKDAIERLCDPLAEVSAHYVICETGKITQLVGEESRAWHAGQGNWGDVCDVNSHSIGIELANSGPDSESPEFPDAQMNALYTLLDGIFHRHSIKPERVIGHSDMAPGRKFDPGPYFNWQQLAERGFSIWPELIKQGAGVDWQQFIKDADSFGYRSVDGSFEGWQPVLDAFRLRFNPSTIGELTSKDMDIMAWLSQNYPCEAVDQHPLNV